MWPVLYLSAIAYFCHHALLDRHGWAGSRRLGHEIALRQEVLDGKIAERKAREADVAGLSLRSLDPDLLDERARAALGLARPDEVIIFKPQPGPSR